MTKSVGASEAMTVQDEDESWGMDPADRWVMVRADISSPVLWHADGSGDWPDALPPIPPPLIERIEAFARPIGHAVPWRYRR